MLELISAVVKPVNNLAEIGIAVSVLLFMIFILLTIIVILSKHYKQDRDFWRDSYMQLQHHYTDLQKILNGTEL